MKKIKRIFYVLVLLVGTIYFDKINASENSIIVGDTELNSTNNVISDGNGGTAKWDSKENTLTLENFNYVGRGKKIENIGIIDADVEFFNSLFGFDDTDDVKIILKGKNVFKFSFDDSEEDLVLLGGFFKGGATFDGDGSLNLTSFDSNNVLMFMAFYIEGEATINNVSIDVDVPNISEEGFAGGISSVPGDEEDSVVNLNHSNLKFNYNGNGYIDSSLYSYKSININNTYLEVKYGEDAIIGYQVLNGSNLLIDNSILKIDTGNNEDIEVLSFDDYDGSDENISIDNSKVTIKTKGTAIVTDKLKVDNSILNIDSNWLTSVEDKEVNKMTFDFSSYNKEGYDVKVDGVSLVEDFPDNLDDKKTLVTIIPEKKGEYKYDLNIGNMKVLTNDIVNYISLTDIEKEFIGMGKNLLIGLNLSDNCDEIDLSLIKNNLEGYVFGKAFDISLFKQLGSDGNKSKISNLSNKIKLSYKLDDSLVSENRTYKVMRVHNGNVDILDAIFNFDTKELVFETDKFSTYAVVYKDIIVLEPEKEINPKTGDNAYVYFIGGILSFVLVVGLLSILKKSN